MVRIDHIIQNFYKTELIDHIIQNFYKTKLILGIIHCFMFSSIYKWKLVKIWRYSLWPICLYLIDCDTKKDLKIVKFCDLMQIFSKQIFFLVRPLSEGYFVKLWRYFLLPNLPCYSSGRSNTRGGSNIGVDGLFRKKIV